MSSESDVGAVAWGILAEASMGHRARVARLMEYRTEAGLRAALRLPYERSVPTRLAALPVLFDDPEAA